jgi:hypothetical protein
MEKRRRKVACAVLAAWVMLMFAGCDMIAELLGLGEEELPENSSLSSPSSPSPDDNNALYYYVSGTGNDSYDGLTEGTPFLTLEKAYGASCERSEAQNNNRGALKP